MRKKILSCVVLVALLLTACTSQTSLPGKVLDREDYTPLVLTGDKFVSVADNGQLELLCNPATSEIAVKEKATGKTYYSNPPKREEDTVANATSKSLMSSQLVLSYATDSNMISEINNYDLSVKNGQFSIYQIENGIKVDYLLHQAKEKVLMPQVCTQEDFEENIMPRFKVGSDVMMVKDAYAKTVMSEISGERKNEILAKYPDAGEYEAIYVMFSSIKNQKLKRLNAAFEKAGFTMEDKAEMEAKVGVIDEEASRWFTASLEYRLDDDNLVVTMPTEDLRAGEDFLITSVSVLPFFGAGFAEDDGFMLVPDGSGAVVDFADEPTLKMPMNLSFYGTDYAMLQFTDPERQPTMRMPVYGIKSGDQSFLAILEDAASIANLKVAVAGQTNQYHSLQVGYDIHKNAEMNVQGISQATIVRVYQETPYQGDCVIRYAFFAGDDTGYSHMASYYRDYLKENGQLNQAAKEDSYPLYANMLCAVDKNLSVAGIPVSQTVPMTTFDEAGQTLQKLQSNGIEDTVMTLSGWNKGGVRGKRPDGVNPEGSLGGMSALKNLLQTGEDLGADLYLDWNGSYFSARSNGLFDSFVTDWHAASAIDQKTAFKREYLVADATPNKLTPWWMIYTPEYKSDLASSFQSSLDKMEKLPGISPNWEGYDLNSDYNTKRVATRPDSQQTDCQVLEGFAQRTQVMVNGANAYALPYADFIQNVPVSSSGLEVYSYDVPFYQMVVHGSVPYAAERRNFSPLDEQTYLLKLLETGSSPAYFWASSDDSILKDSDFNKWYSLNTENWIQSVTQLYQEAASVLAPLSTLQITQHTRLEDGVYCVVYGDAIKVYINYTSSQVKTEGITLQPKSYQVVEA